MSKKIKTRSSGDRKSRKYRLGRTSVALATAMTAGLILAPTGANAALTTGLNDASYESATAEGTQTTLRDALRDQPKSEMAKSAFVQLAALCGGGSSGGRDADCVGSVTTNSNSDSSQGEPTNNIQIY